MRNLAWLKLHRVFFISLFFVMTFIPAEAHASFIGMRNTHKVCHTKITLGNTDFAESSPGHMWLNAKRLGKLSPNAQRAIIGHECGHVHGIKNELAADRYGLTHYPTKRSTVNELCQFLRNYNDDYAEARCKQMKRYAH